MFELVLFVLYLVFIPVFYGKLLYFWQYAFTKDLPNQEFWQKFRDNSYNNDVFFSLFFAITWPITVFITMFDKDYKETQGLMFSKGRPFK